MTASAPAPIIRALTLRARGTAWSTIKAITGVTEALAARHLADPAQPLRLRGGRPKAPPPGIRILTPRERAMEARQRYIEEAARAVTRFAGYTITAGQLLATPRTRQESHVRFFAMAWLRWAFPALSSTQVGVMFKVHHTTILHAEKRARALYPDAPFCKRRPENLDARLTALGLEA